MHLGQRAGSLRSMPRNSTLLTSGGYTFSLCLNSSRASQELPVHSKRFCFFHTIPKEDSFPERNPNTVKDMGQTSIF